jgi:SAM-dependent methyltransferase
MPAVTNFTASTAPIRVPRRRTNPLRRQVQRPKDWTVPWFNSSYYHTLYENRNEDEARFFMDNMIRLLQLGPDSTILDLGCGRGRHAVYLGATGANVTGIDIARQSIAYARRYEHDRLHFEIGDMREPYGEQRFSEIFNLFTSFGYFAGESDNLNVLRQAARALRPEGRIVIDFLNAEKVIRTLVPHEIKKAQSTRFEIARRLEGGFIVKDIIVSIGGTSRHYQERVQVLFLSDFLGYLRAVGLHVLHTFGNYALCPFDVPTSDRLILIAQKPT